LRPNDSGRRLRRKMIPMAASLIAATIALAGCGGDGDQADAASQDTVTVKNCGEEITFPSPAKRIFVNENPMLSMLFTLDADDQIAAVSGISDGKRDMLEEIFDPERIDDLPHKTDQYPTIENILVEKPDVVLAGFGWGYSVDDNLTPSHLYQEHEISAYTSSTTCEQETSDEARGIMPPWEALYTDITNLGKIVGRSDRATSVVADIKRRLEKLKSAPSADEPATVFSINLIGKEVTSGGAFSAAHGVIEAAGGRNANEDVKDQWARLSWERVAASNVDYFLITDIGAGDHSYKNKVRELKENPATKNLDAVKESRFIRIPRVMVLDTPLMIDSAELLRKALEDEGLAPESEIEPELEIHD